MHGGCGDLARVWMECWIFPLLSLNLSWLLVRIFTTSQLPSFRDGLKVTQKVLWLFLRLVWQAFVLCWRLCLDSMDTSVLIATLAGISSLTDRKFFLEFFCRNDLFYCSFFSICNMIIQVVYVSQGNVERRWTNESEISNFRLISF